MSWSTILVLAVVTVLMLGPLRRWAGRHWAFLLSLVLGWTVGYGAGTFLVRRFGVNFPYLPLLWGLVGAAFFATGGLAVLRRIEQDGKP